MLIHFMFIIYVLYIYIHFFDIYIYIEDMGVLSTIIFRLLEAREFSHGKSCITVAAVIFPMEIHVAFFKCQTTIQLEDVWCNKKSRAVPYTSLGALTCGTKQRYSMKLS